MQQSTTINLQGETIGEEEANIPRERRKQKEKGGLEESFPSLEEALGELLERLEEEAELREDGGEWETGERMGKQELL